MKSNLRKLLLISILAGFSFTLLFSQETAPSDTLVRKLSVVVKNDGSEYIGYIISLDDRELLIETSQLGRLYIPKHEIKSIKEIKEGEYKSGQYLGNDIFSTRYFYSTNGLAMKEGQYYALWNIYGPEIHYATSDRFAIGGMTSYILSPIVATLKYAIPLEENISFCVGSLIGTTSWAEWSGFGILPFASLTFGNYNKNFTLSGGYTYITYKGDSRQGVVLSIAGLGRIGRKIAFVGDSFIYTSHEFFAVFIPGLRFSSSPDKAFQLGFAGVYVDGEFLPSPIPMLGWFRIF